MHLVGGGLHCNPDGLNMECADRFFDKLRPGAKHYMFAALHAPGYQKDPAYVERFGPRATRLFNQMIRDRAARLGAVVFDAFAISVNETSIDGQHYLVGTNVDIAQLLLNLVAAMHRDDLRAASTRASRWPKLW